MSPTGQVWSQEAGLPSTGMRCHISPLEQGTRCTPCPQHAKCGHGRPGLSAGVSDTVCLLPAWGMGSLPSSTQEARCAHQNNQSSGISPMAGTPVGGSPNTAKCAPRLPLIPHLSCLVGAPEQSQAQQGLLSMLLLPSLFRWLWFLWIVSRDSGNLIDPFIHITD